MKYRVGIPKVIWAYIDVEVDETEFTDDGEINEAALREHVEQEAFQETPNLCAQCTGWGQSWSIEEDDWGSVTEVAPKEYPITVEKVN
jgi:hypothetical protein